MNNADLPIPRAMPAAWNDTAADFPHTLCAHHLFEAQVRRTPHAVAVVYGERSLTYRELNQRANQVAHQLRAEGVGPDVLVSICVERSLEMAVGVLGILKAGGAYVPIDFAYPKERLAQILGDAQAKVLVTQRKLLPHLPAHQGRTLFLDDQPLGGAGWDEDPAVPMSPECLGYVIYTSGSTGRPKGICLPHRALVNLLAWHDRTMLRCANTLQYASLSFDASFHEMFAAWHSGGTLFLISEALRRDIAALAQFICDQKIAKVILPVIVLSQLAEHVRDRPHLLSNLKEITTTGEQLQITSPIIQLFRQLPGCVFHNHYGPSESHVVTAFTMSPDIDTWTTHPPIGRPIANTRIYLLDEQRNQVPLGQPGELYIGGVCLARCYLGAPELTASRFIRDPFSTDPEARLYRTGDLARYCPDGNLEYLGRIDHQVKIRGFRIELGEIEAVLSKHPAVREVAVLAREDVPGDKRLVAYVVPEHVPSDHPDPLLAGEPIRTLGAELRALLRAKLPDYMVPAAFVMLAAMPLTQNGKLDRRALPAPGRQRPELDAAFVAPRSELELALVALFEQVLHTDGIGVQDSFLDLGGNSIHAAQLLTRIRTTFSCEVSFQRFFAEPTVSALAGLLQALGKNSPQDVAIPVVPRDGALALSFAQERLFFLYQLTPEGRAYNCPSGFRLKGALDEQALDHSLRELVQRHEILRTRFTEAAGRPLQIIDAQPAFSLAVRDLQTLPDAEREIVAHRHMSEEAQRLFHLATGPLFRATLLRLAPDEHLLLLNFHHIVIDGWSMEVVLRELALLYASFISHTPCRLPPLSIQYADYAAWQRRQANSDTQQEMLKWWKQKLHDVPPLLQLPADHPRPAIQSFRGSKVSFRIDSSLTAVARGLAASRGMTLSMTLLAAFAALIHRYTRGEDILIGIPSANRHRVELEGMLGFFINTLPIRLDLSAEPTFLELLARVRAASIEAYERDALPFEQLVQELRHERSASYNPVVQIGFAPQPPSERALQLPRVQAEYVDVDANKTVFDLTLYLWEEPASTAALIEYSTDLFERSTIERIAEHYVRLLTAATQNLTCPVSALPLLASGASSATSERETILSGWNHATTDLGAHLCLHELFEAQVARAPSAVAVALEQQQVAYGELDRRANQLAHHLRQRGLAKETTVGSCLERSLDSVVAFLGILKAGGVYLPLDPGYPASRLLGMLEDSAAPILLTHARHVEQLAGYTGQVICLDEEAPKIAACSGEPPARQTQPENAAYLIYTSGSTGRPKGVVIEHRNAVNFVFAQQRVVGASPGSRVLHAASPSFDASIWELLIALTAGATLYPVPPRASLPGPELSRYLQKQSISIAFLSPSALAQLPFEELPALATLLTGGEACSAELVERWASGRRFINAYGPTEATVCATMQVCTPSAWAPSIGRPMENARVYVLDSAGQLVPIGVPGEIYLGGESVARGYLNRPEISSQRFLPDPFSPSPGARMYRTGDLGQWRPDGSLEFLGRIDQQIKLRGFRIELGEIESVLREHPLIQSAAVVIREDPGSAKRLVGYLVPRVMDASASQPRTALHKELVGDWHSLYEDVYTRADAASDPTFNIEGWNSSFTGLPIPSEQMRSWVTSTVGRVAALHPQRVLEIGCGSGLLLFQLAPSCQRYVGTDFSQAALSRLGQQLGPRGLTQVSLEQCEANRIADLPEQAFDTVIINSVVQYFPGPSYLREVVAGAVSAVGSQGVIFIGDVRSLPLREAFHTAVQLHQSAPPTPIAALRDKVARAVANDKELLLAPEFFGSLGQELGSISHCEVWLKRGHGTDEMTRYRYDVLLFIGSTAAAVAISESRQWRAVDGSLSGLERWLAQESPAVAEVLAIPNARVFADWLAFQKLHESEGSCEEIVARITQESAAAIAPEALWQLGERLGYTVRVTYSLTGGAACMDALFERGGAAPYPRPWRPMQHRAQPSSTGYANDPLRAKQTRSLVPKVREFLQSKLPSYMVPSAFVVLDALPLNASGKLDRKLLSAPEDVRPELGHDFVAPTTALQGALATIWRSVLGIERIGIDDPFFDLGGHSLLLAQVRSAILTQLGREVPLIKLLQHVTIRGLEAYLEGGSESESKPGRRPESGALRPVLPANPSDAVAVIGLAGRFPKAGDVEELWDHLRAGAEGITFFTPAELAELGVDPEVVQSPRFVPACGVLQDPMGFDASFFGCGPREAQYMDPQHRAFLECAWSGLEDAGYPPGSSPGSVGVFAGAEAARYWIERIGLTGGPWNAVDYQAVHGNLPDNLTTRVAYKLGLSGPAVTVLTACSTSLVAIHLACQQLLWRQCDLALAGGVGIHSPFAAGHLYQDGGLMSRTGHCQPFDLRADGIVSGSGVAVVVLKRLADALADGDHIRAVIRGSALNNDGSDKASYMAPSIAGQLDVLKKAYAAAGVVPESLSFVEAHGTATRLGDTIEFAALNRAFQEQTSRRQFCALGSVKSNLGHLGAAAGVTGFIKATLALERELIPPTLHFKAPPAEIDLENSPFFINTQPLTWPRGPQPRRAGVSAFGVGGTNAHIVLEEAPAAPPSGASRSTQVLLLSARTGSALEAATSRLAGHLQKNPEVCLPDVAFTLQRGRTPMAQRRAIVAGGTAEALERLHSRDSAYVFTSAVPTRKPKLVFMFPGGGTQRVTMGKQLYDREPLYRQALDRCALLFQAELGSDLRELLFPAPGREHEAEASLLRPSLNNAAIFATEFALTELLLSWGLQPVAATGHSLGEYAAACLAGVLTVEDAVRLVALRGRIYDEQTGGASMSVLLSEAALTKRLEAGVEIAAVNGPASCVVAGKRAAVERLQAQLTAEGHEARLLAIDCAVHCASVEPHMARLTERATGMNLRAPRLPLVSNLTGRYLSEQEACDPSYWARHLRGTVRFADGLNTLLGDPDTVLLEVGPGWTLSALCRRHSSAGPERLAVATLAMAGSSRSDEELLMCALAQLWCRGIDVDWQAFSAAERRRRVPLPTYPFDRLPYDLKTRAMRPNAMRSAAPVAAAPAQSPARESGISLPTVPTLHDPIAQKLAALWADALGTIPGPTANFFDHGGSSFTAVQLCSKVRDELQVALPVHALMQRATFNALVDHVRELRQDGELPMVDGALPREGGELVVQLQAGESTHLPLFLIQPIGGTVYTYAPLVQHLDPKLPVYGVRASGMEPGEPILSDLPTIMAAYLRNIRSVQPCGPYVLGGHSAGGVIAFALAEQLIEEEQKVQGVFLIDSPSQEEIQRTAGLSVAQLLNELGNAADSQSEGQLGLAAALREETPFRAIALGTLSALAAYPLRALPVDLTYILAKDEPAGPEGPAGNDAQRARFWMEKTDHDFRLHKVAGTHFTMMEPPLVGAIAERLHEGLLGSRAIAATAVPHKRDT